MSPLTKYVFHLLKVGTMPKKGMIGDYSCGGVWTEVEKDIFYGDYADKMKVANIHQRSFETEIGIGLKDLIPGVKSEKHQRNGTEIRVCIPSPRRVQSTVPQRHKTWAMIGTETN